MKFQIMLLGEIHQGGHRPEAKSAEGKQDQRGMQAGFYRYLTKPVKVTEFVATIESLLASR